MNVASLELCKELHELSGWVNAQFDWVEIPTWNPKFPKPADCVVYNHVCDTEHQKRICPAYDLGYLMRSLPDGFTIVTRFNEGWLASWAETAQAPDIAVEAATPEDAAAKLAIELFKQGVLVREAHE